MADDTAGETFGARLKRLREAAGMTQQQLADAAGMHRIGLSKLERDTYEPGWSVVQSLAKALGVSCAVFEGAVAPSLDKPPAKMGRPRKPAAAPPDAAASAEPEPTKKRKKKPE